MRPWLEDHIKLLETTMPPRSFASSFWVNWPFFRILLPLALELLAVHSAWAGILSKDDIQRRFGVPFVVEEKLRDIPAWPVTSSLEKEAGPVAYVFESIDIAPLPGFEGSPMNFLISIDRKGTFTGVEVLQQREPVFTFRDLGGLGDAPSGSSSPNTPAKASTSLSSSPWMRRATTPA
jgi:hypothetical protein